VTPIKHPIDPSLHPKCQTTLVGHQAAYDQLWQSFQSGTMPPIWLLAGERGIGKATLAYAIARKILAHEGQDPTIVTRQMAQDSYPNFLALTRKLNADGKLPREITAEEARKVAQFLRQHAAIPGWRVVIIDAVNEMNRTAANSLLKILEEPPVKTIFFLITHSLGQVLPTIRSRCCKLQLYPLKDAEITESLNANIAPEILSLAQGSIGRAMALQQAGGVQLLDQLIQTITGALKGDWRPAQALSASFDKDNPGYETMLDLILWTLHRLILLAHMPLSGKSSDEKLSQLTKTKPMTHWVDAFHRISQFLETARTSHLDRNHVIMAVFFMIENPTVGDEFVYESF
jgi:DNA polymerase-3 subunit delta'